MYDPALVKGQGAEIASSEASAVHGDAEFYFLDGRDAAFSFIHGMPGPRIGEGVDIVELGLREGQGRRILYDAQLSGAGLDQGPGLERVSVLVLDP